eukprot:CAMPEP_0115148352 /NCGR_PEP_ID=MMETSP0227-20121206/63823_1 /TAXON_ID=89957 /ORGANISM="Polarella glacialis, Strain CCMP 1383" /LENGTH=42 /DNA_ID= /DNA_START= /DNA_END= /DNA_ORIENTATION=
MNKRIFLNLKLQLSIPVITFERPVRMLELEAILDATRRIEGV